MADDFYDEMDADEDVDCVEYCPAREDGTHCNCWWDGEPCCACGSDEGEVSE